MNDANIGFLIRLLRKHGLGIVILLYLGYLGLHGKIEFSYPRQAETERSLLGGSH